VVAQFDNGDLASLDAGDGAVLGIGIDLTPLRTGPHALGFSVEQGVKFNSIEASNASISLIRFPLVVSVHYHLQLSDTLAFVAGGGLVHEYGIQIEGSGDLSDVQGDLDDATGWMGEGGVAYLEGPVVVDITLRYTGLTYEGGDSPESADADSVAFVVAGHYFF